MAALVDAESTPLSYRLLSPTLVPQPSAVVAATTTLIARPAERTSGLEAARTAATQRSVDPMIALRRPDPRAALHTPAGAVASLVEAPTTGDAIRW